MAKIEKNKNTSELLVKISAPKELWAQEQEKAFKKLAQNLSLKGFRKGQVPIEIARKTIQQTEIFTGALKNVLDILVKDAAKEVSDDVVILDSPAYKVNSIDEDDLEVTFIYPIYPEVKLADYKKITSKYEAIKVPEDALVNELEKIRQTRAITSEKNGPLEKGDIAIFDFEGFVDGQPFEGGKAHNYELQIGSGQFIAGFEDQMEGLAIGDKKDVNVSFPAEYQVEALKGKAAVFKIKLNGIKVKVLPELNDEIISTLNVPNVKNLEQLKSYINNVFSQQAEQDSRAKFQQEVFEELRKNTEAALPLSVVAREMQNQEKQFMEQLKKQGLDLKRYSEMSGQTIEQLRSQFKASAENKLKDSLIFAEIAKQEKIELSEQDYDKAYAKFAVIYGQTAESVKAVITKAQLQVPLINEMVIDILIKNSESK